MRSARSLLILPLVCAASACTATVPVEAAPAATAPVCAEVVLALPQLLGEDLRRLRAGGQATAAWGEPTDPVVLRCGVVPPGPTTDQCVTADDGTTAVDWVLVTDEQGDWRFTTYGREPAIELVVPTAVAEQRSRSFMLDLNPAIAKVKQTRVCL